MRLMIESTGIVTTVNGVRVRLWRGQTEAGNKVDVFVQMISVDVREAPDAVVQCDFEFDDLGPPRELRQVALRDIFP